MNEHDVTSGTLDLSGLIVRISGLPPIWLDRLALDLEPYVGRDGGGAPILDIRVQPSVRPLPEVPFAPKELAGDYREDRAHFRLAEGSAEVDHRGKVRVDLVDSDDPRVYFAFLNLLRACLAWALLRSDGAMIHAAGLVLEGRAFVLVGQGGAGKSTWARCGEEGGGKVISDDVVLVQTRDGVPTLLGAPFRSTWRGPMHRGCWPLAAILLANHGPEPRLEPASPILARARLLANLPFTTPAGAADSRPLAAVERLVDAVPCYTLTYAPDPSFVGLLRDLETGPRSS